MLHRSPILSALLAATALSGSLASGEARAQDQQVRLDEIAVEAVRTGPQGTVTGAGVATSQNSSATSGGGGGPSGVTGYTARVSPTATKTNTPLIETPQSVTVVTREQLNDRNVQDVNQALAYVPGTSTNVFGFDPRFDAFYIRGFSATYDGIFRDGLRQSAVGLAVPRIEPYGTEALTILRGPASGSTASVPPAVSLTSRRNDPSSHPSARSGSRQATTIVSKGISISAVRWRDRTARWPTG